MLPFDRPRVRARTAPISINRACMLSENTDNPKMDSPQYLPELNDLEPILKRVSYKLRYH